MRERTGEMHASRCICKRAELSEGGKAECGSCRLVLDDREGGPERDIWDDGKDEEY